MTQQRKQHAMTRSQITPAIVREDLDYDPLTGVFRWRAIRVGVSRGAEVGSINKHGYVVVPLRTVQFQAHRLAWAHYFGVFPSGQIDHINRNKTDNRIANLRLASPSQNKGNTGPQKNNSSGVKGIYWNKKDKRWIARIQKSGVRITLGWFKTRDAAIAAYSKAAKDMFGEFAVDANPPT